MSIFDFANPYHAYIFGTSFWYFLRGIVRVIDPATVCDWFRPPSQLAEPNDLELYTTRVDAWGLLTLSALLLVLADAVPLPNSLVGSTLNSTFTTSPSATRTKRPYAPAIIFVTILHHIATGIGSYSHWSRPSHRTIAMDIGVWGNVGLALLGAAALAYLNGGAELAGSVGEVLNKESDNLQEKAQSVVGSIREDVRDATRSTRKRG